MTSERTLAPISLVVLLGLLGCAGCAPFERGERRMEPDAGAAHGGVDASGPDAGGGGPSFTADVHPILVARCSTCHVEGAPGGATAYVLADDAAVDRATVLALVDADDADASRLLVKGRGEMHTGGAALPRDSADYATVLAWIEAGTLP